MSTRETKSDGVQRGPTRRRRKRGTSNNNDQTQDDQTVGENETEAGTARAPKSGGGSRARVKQRGGTRKGCANVVPGKNAVTPEVEAAMADFVTKTLAKGVEGIRKEFAELKTYTAPEFKFEQFTANAARNRYKDVVCLDATRVVLNLNVPPETDYIHANNVKMPGLERQYIATQGPLESTIPDFWRLVHQESASSVVMLCKCIEDGKNKCAAYFPEANAYKTYGSMFVNNKKTEPGDVLTHTIEVLPDGCSNSTVIKLLQMLDWPDRGVPEKPMGVLRLLRTLPAGLCIIHCSAGIGRTGTVILIDTIVSRLLKGQTVVVKEAFQELRNQRASAVQTEAQYVLIHTCVLEYIRAKMPAKYRDAALTFAEDVKKANMV
uniref:Tyrosine-protein phosphatase domain-containing protein n=1 Tax=Panagrellus redivivus TaxID=6233 RepID=A0A7E4VZX7_PANRE